MAKEHVRHVTHIYIGGDGNGPQGVPGQMPPGGPPPGMMQQQGGQPPPGAAMPPGMAQGMSDDDADDPGISQGAASRRLYRKMPATPLHRRAKPKGGAAPPGKAARMYRKT
jgi:hypothetical protein